MPISIILPAGTSHVTVRDIPRLIAEALHPSSLDASTEIVSELMKLYDQPGAIPAPQSEPLNDGDWRLLRALWHGLPVYRERLTKDEWQPYAEAFEASKHRPKWQLLVFWVGTKMQNEMTRYFTENEHRDALQQAVNSGSLVVRSLSMIPMATAAGEMLQSAIVTIPDLSKYLRRFEIDIAEGSTLATIPDDEIDLCDAIRIDEAAKSMGCTVDSLLREAAADQRLLYLGIGPGTVNLVAPLSHKQPPPTRRQFTGHKIVAMHSEYAKAIAMNGVASVRKWQAAFDGGALDWHVWVPVCRNCRKPGTGLNRILNESKVQTG